MGLSGRPRKLSSRVWEEGLQSPEESGLSSDRQRSVCGAFQVLYICICIPVTVVEARVGDAGVSGRVQEGVLAPSS